MNFRHVRMLLLLFTMILWNVLLNAWILERTRQINCFSYETALYSFREPGERGTACPDAGGGRRKRNVGKRTACRLFCGGWKRHRSRAAGRRGSVCKTVSAAGICADLRLSFCRVGRSGTFSGRDGGLRRECGSELCRQLDAEQELWR